MVKIKNPMTIVSSGGSATLVPKTITANGQYNPADDNADGYSAVTVSVPAPVNKFKSLVDRSITSVTAEDLAGATTIGQYAFAYCSSLQSVEIPNGITEIKNAAFYYCTALSDVIIPDSATSIGRNAFEQGGFIEKRVIIGSGISTIEFAAFRYSDRMQYIIIRATTPPTLVNSNAFDSTNNCPIYVPYSADHSILAAYKAATNWSALESRIFEDFAIIYQITGTGECEVYATAGNRLEPNVVIPSVSPAGDTVISIGSDAFQGNNIVSVAVPNTVEIINGNNAGGGAFENCSYLETVSIGNGITSIGKNIFKDCTALESVTIYATTPPTLKDVNAFENTTCTIYVPAASVNAYKTATNWSAFADRIFAIQE